MTLAERVEQIVTDLYPDATFLLASEFQADYESLANDDSTFIVLNNLLEDDDSIQENSSVQTRTRIQLSVFIKDEFDTKDRDTNDLVEQAKEISRKVYQNLWYSSEVNAQASDANVTHRPIIKELNSIRSGVLSLANWVMINHISCT